MSRWKFRDDEIDRYKTYASAEEIERWQKSGLVPPPPGLTFRFWPPETQKEIDAAVECLKQALKDREEALSTEQLTLRDAADLVRSNGHVLFDDPNGAVVIEEEKDELPWWFNT